MSKKWREFIELEIAQEEVRKASNTGCYTSAESAINVAGHWSNHSISNNEINDLRKSLKGIRKALKSY